MTSKVNTAPIKWAQRSDSLYITIALADVDKDATINLKDETLTFKGKSENKEYELDIVFFKPVDSEGSTYKVLPRSVVMHVMKKEKDDEEFWPRLLKDKALEKNRVKIDWDRYVDEDEEEEGFDKSALEGGMGMGGAGGMPGMGGMDMASMMGGMGGGAGGMDMASMMAGMGGAGGMPGMPGMGGGGPGGMDMEALMKQMGDMGGGAAGGGGADSDDDDSDDDDLPELEES